MNCRDVRKIRAERSVDQLSERVRNHVDRCADCAAFFKRQDAVESFIALGRLEQPAAGFETRLLDAIHENNRKNLRIVKPSRFGKSFQEWVFSAWRWVAAAGLIASIGGWVRHWDPAEPMPFSTAMGPIQASAPLFMDYRHLMSAIAIPDPSPPLAVADTFSSDSSQKPDPQGLRFIGYQP